MDSRQVSTSKARCGVKVAASEVPFGRDRDTTEDVLIELGEGPLVLGYEIRVDIPCRDAQSSPPNDSNTAKRRLRAPNA